MSSTSKTKGAKKATQKALKSESKNIDEHLDKELKGTNAEEGAETPTALLAVEEVADKDKNLLILYKDRCTECKYLVAHGKKYYDQCYYLAGNPRCPAKSTRLVVGLPIQSAALQIAKAQIEGDFVKESKLRKELLKYDPLILKQVSTMTTNFIRDPELYEIAVEERKRLKEEKAKALEAEASRKKEAKTKGGDDEEE